jgi:hypothetical protein
VLGAWLAAAAQAELVRVEAIGTVALGAGSGGGARARQDALEAGIRDAVLRTAQDLVLQAGSTADAEAVRAAVGYDAKSLAAAYRILEDRGEREPLLESSPGAEREYVVAVEVEVDRARLRSRLAQAGLLPAATTSAPGAARQVVLEGVDSYRLWLEIRDALRARGGEVRALEFAPGRIVAELGAEESLGSLAGRLAASLGERFEVQPLGDDPGELRIGIVRRPALDEMAPDAADPASSAPSDLSPAPSAR